METLKNENARLEALAEYNILDSLPEKDYDDITRLASEICQTPISLVSLIDAKRQWFKSSHGMEASETSREFAFCGHAIMHPEEIFIVPDSREDKRFAENPFVTGDPNVIFYAGVPLVNPEGFPFGTLCVIDKTPRKLTQNQLDSLKALANQIVNLLELRRKNIFIERSKAELQNRYNELEKFAYVVSHDIKSTLNNILRLTDMLREDYGNIMDEMGLKSLDFLNRSSGRLKSLVDGLLSYYRGDQLLTQKEENTDLKLYIEDIISLLDLRGDVQIIYPNYSHTLLINRVALQQVILNLLSNAVKYNDKPNPVIEIVFSEDDNFYYFSVKDNGSGIAEQDKEKIFTLFSHLGKRDRYNNVGTGIGLATVKKLVENLGGNINVVSEEGKGTSFSFSIKKVIPVETVTIAPTFLIS